MVFRLGDPGGDGVEFGADPLLLASQEVDGDGPA